MSMASDSRKIMFMYPHRNKTFLKIAIALVKVDLIQISYNFFLPLKQVSIKIAYVISQSFRVWFIHSQI